MRRTLALLAAALLLAPPALGAQSAPAGGAAAAPTPTPTPTAAELREAVSRIGGENGWFGVPSRDAVAGPRTIAAGDTVVGDVAVTGTLEVHGTVTGCLTETVGRET